MTSNVCSVQGALEWLESNQDKSYEEIVATSEKGGNVEHDLDAEPAPIQPGEQARSLVCNECGKKFRSQAQAEFHASKTQHVDFAESQQEIAPMTKEEKEAQIEEARLKLAEKRARMSEQDKIDKKRNEVSRVDDRMASFLADRVVGDPTEEYKRNTRSKGRP